MDRLLVEIGTEEIPAGYINPALAFFSSNLLKRLSDSRIEHGEAKTFGTPRRLTVIVNDVADRQTSLINEVTGPPENVGFDANGSPTMAAIKFAEKNGISVSQIKVKNTEKGRYLVAVQTEAGQATSRVLQKILPDIILSIPFPKTMRWSDLRIQFARPIHSICALLGEKVISFQLENIKSNKYTFGHRFLKPGKIKLSTPDDYADKLNQAFVLADIDQRKSILKDQMNEAVKSVGGTILQDDELVDIVANLVEYPFPVIGQFDEKFLELPSEILITAMREHQKYFAIIDPQKKLMPYFVAINNMQAKDISLVAAGHERVLRARLEDARFFYNADSKTSLDEMSLKLKSVLFQAQLGSVYDKSLRIEKLAVKLSELLNLDSETKKRISRAATLCKADLVSHVVGEFPKLQGIMGKNYAMLANEQENVAAAIEDHYRPTFSGGMLPSVIEGAVVSIADKIDSICGFFNIGLIPTGTTDPHGLRRQGIGVIQIILDRNLNFSLKELINQSLLMFDKIEVDSAEKVHDFLKGRMAHLLKEEGISKDAVSAILSASAENVADVWKRAHALQALKSDPDFEILAIAFKRVVNIIKKADSKDTENVHTDISLFEHQAELVLYDQFQSVKKNVIDLLKSGNVSQSFKEIASLRPIVDQFFDDVLVMAEDIKIRKNRLALLGEISGLFGLLADFSKIST